MAIEEISGLLDHITRPAAFGAFAAIGGSAWSAIISPDILPAIGGIAVGIVGLGWSIFMAGRDKRVDTLLAQIKTLQGLLDECQGERQAGEKERKDLWIENYRLKGEMERLKARFGDAV